MATTIYRTVGDTAQLGVLLVVNGAGISGEVPTVEIRRLRDGWYFDWAAVAAPYWKTTGGTKEETIPEKSWQPGLYLVPWDQQAYDEGNEEEYAIIYRNAGTYAFTEVEMYVFGHEWAVDIVRLRKMLTNKTVLHKNSDTNYTQTTYEDDGVAVLQTDTIIQVGDDETREPV